ncbi:5-(carboxyamino)imidazole ribonucleotide mutase [bacterium]|nr:5-(carboxyamino)imidazole ribonucleotide mutase [bacterium]
MIRVAVFAGSKSDTPLIDDCCRMLSYFGLEPVVYTVSAHRQPDKLRRTIEKINRDESFKVIIAIAGLSAHLPGICASLTHLPVIGVPANAGPLNGFDALLSMVQMPKGVPVATVAIGASGAVNSALLAARIIALFNDSVRSRLKDYISELKG